MYGKPECDVPAQGACGMRHLASLYRTKKHAPFFLLLFSICALKLIVVHHFCGKATSNDSVQVSKLRRTTEN
jgi:hypothetical protein